MPATANTSIASSASEHLTITAGQVQANGITIAYESFGATDRETVLLVVLIVIINGIAWLDGSTQFGKFDLYRTSIPFYPVSILVLMHYLDNVARHARAVFRPALGASEAEYARFEY